MVDPNVDGGHDEVGKWKPAEDWKKYSARIPLLMDSGGDYELLGSARSIVGDPFQQKEDDSSIVYIGPLRRGRGVHWGPEWAGAHSVAYHSPCPPVGLLDGQRFTRFEDLVTEAAVELLEKGLRFEDEVDARRSLPDCHSLCVAHEGLANAVVSVGFIDCEKVEHSDAFAQELSDHHVSLFPGLEYRVCIDDEEGCTYRLIVLLGEEEPALIVPDDLRHACHRFTGVRVRDEGEETLRILNVRLPWLINYSHGEVADVLFTLSQVWERTVRGFTPVSSSATAEIAKHTHAVTPLGSSPEITKQADRPGEDHITTWAREVGVQEKLPADEFLLLLTVALRVNVAWHLVRTPGRLGELTGMSGRKVTKLLRRLHRRGILVIRGTQRAVGPDGEELLEPAPVVDLVESALRKDTSNGHSDTTR
nr:hypothetical protein [Brevibacterium sp.]